MNIPQISIIIPVYNVDQYLNRCLDSVLSQSFTDFEVLLIDDGSADRSGRICDEYVERDSRVRVFHKPNGGVSSARNLGLDNIKGEWVYFVDADDELFENSLDTLISGIDDTTDVVMGAYVKSDTDQVFSMFDEPVVTTNKEQSVAMLYNSRNYQGFLWIRMFRTNIIKKENLRFDTTIQIKEDTLFILQYLCYSCGFTKLFSHPVYYYRIHEGSAMMSVNCCWNPKYLTSFSAVEKMNVLVRENFPNNKYLIRMANCAMVERYRTIGRLMRQDNSFKINIWCNLCIRCFKQLGVFFVYSELIRCFRVLKRCSLRLFR